jgi:hypothetical protein
VAAVLLEVRIEAVVPERASEEWCPLVCALNVDDPPPVGDSELLLDIASGGKGSSLFNMSELFRGGCELGGEGALAAGDFICLICFNMNTGFSFFSLSCFIRSNGLSLYVKIRSIIVVFLFIRKMACHIY